MILDLFSLYLQFNLLLAAAYLLWLATRLAARLLQFESSCQDQLKLARFCFLALLVGVPAIGLSSAMLPGMVSTLMPTVVTYAGEMSVATNIDAGLSQRLELGGRQLSLAWFLLGALALGMLIQATQVSNQWLRLRQVVAQGIPLRNIHGVQVLVSERVMTPFSTCALGFPCLVLPYRLLESPANLRIAIRHELQHLRNGDLSWVLFMEAVKLLCFWNPAAHAWHHEFDQLQEFACDEVLVGQGQLNAKTYGHCLLDVASYTSEKAFVASSNMVPRFSLLGMAHSQLRRRITMLQHTKTISCKALRKTGYGLLFGAGLLNASLLVFAQPEGARQEYLPIVTIQPQYPRVALEDEISGWVQVAFTVTAEGYVSDVMIEDSCFDGPVDSPTFDDGCLVDYREDFHAAASRAIERFRFNPRYQDGVAVATPGVQYVFRFNISDDDQDVPREIIRRAQP